ncbi:thermonuclease family protein [uncultured Piscinibacter sp.]|uniref:thermonuclease family protein n=1 Tax=uncultured Piscinibacter sp. TaxID=1131835 RepID=UPI002624365C|nr:thermonuclease family protein [uncultured Piscinibacter sp.]
MKAALLFLGLACAGVAQAMSGVVIRVSDGDTVWVRPDGVPARKPVKLRLIGIDAPERCQAWGTEATAALSSQVLQRRVEVPARGVDAYGRLLGGLLLSDGRDVSAWMVSQGHAWSARFRRHPGPYASQQRDAQTRRAGLFADPAAVEPWVFRKAHGPCEAGAGVRSSSSPG